MATAARGLGWHPFPGPAAINSQTYDDRPGCLYHGFCNRGGCHVNAKNSTAVTHHPQGAVATGRLGVVTQAIVTSVAVDEQRPRDAASNYLKGGEEYFQPADVVLLAGYTYENVRMLLLSKSKPFPNGLVQQRRPGRPALLQPPHRRGGHRAVPVRPQQLVRAAGAGRRGRQLGRRQLRPCRPRLHRRRQSLGLFRPPPDRRPRS